ncbi:hypothetical protein L3Y34_015161 [Caenorhabditis briggsae]|uniref:Uncharacterized protein n=1 Tax=Caenorhabditis briggsae TaxID=6238 RepID=A0AAE9DSW2_CAEBR|nr:hypothetical protein L3Y34_015161 [Caenorhabditis briggsae]
MTAVAAILDLKSFNLIKTWPELANKTDDEFDEYLACSGEKIHVRLVTSREKSLSKRMPLERFASRNLSVTNEHVEIHVSTAKLDI